MAKMLLILNSENPYHRLLRRGVVIAIAAGISAFATGLLANNLSLIPIAYKAYAQIFLTGLLALADKATRFGK